MNPEAMAPFGKALLACFEGDKTAELVIRREDGKSASLPAAIFFRSPDQFSRIDNVAIERCAGDVLDVGAGAGLHSLVLVNRGLSVTSIDVDPDSVEIMQRRGLANAQCADVFDFEENRYDTMLMMGHGIGMVETIAGLERFFHRAGRLLRDGGQILLDSLDVSKSDDPKDLAYHEANKQAGRYIGEVRMRFEFGGEAGAYCGWLHVDADTLTKRAADAGWQCDVVHEEDRGDYLARLVRLPRE